MQILNILICKRFNIIGILLNHPFLRSITLPQTLQSPLPQPLPQGGGAGFQLFS